MNTIFNKTSANKKQIIVVAVVSVLAILFTNYGITVAAGWFGREAYHGYFKDKVDYYGDNVITNGLGKDNPNYTLAAFKFEVIYYLNEGSVKDKTGARFIVMTMLNKPAGMPWNDSFKDEWINFLVPYEDSNKANGTVNMNTTAVVYSNTFYQDDWQDVANYTPSTPLLNQEVIIFTDSTGGTYTIRKECGNPVNGGKLSTEPEGNLLTLSGVKMNEVPGDQDLWKSAQTPSVLSIDYGDTDNRVYFRNAVGTGINPAAILKNASFGFRTDVYFKDNSGKKMGDAFRNENLLWGQPPETHLATFTANNVSVNDNKKFMNGMTPTLNDSFTYFKIKNSKIPGLVGRQICRSITASDMPIWLNPVNNPSEACVLIKGSNITITAGSSEYEKGSNKDLKIPYTVAAGSVYCSGAIAIGTPITFTVTRTIIDIDNTIKSGVFTLNNCVSVATAINIDGLNGETISANLLDGKNVGNHNINLDITAKIGTENRVIESNYSPGTVSIYEAPFVVFNGNDVRACPAVDKSRFVYVPNSPIGGVYKGSRTWLASLWANSVSLTADDSNGWSNGLNTYNNNNAVNNIKAKGIVCDEPANIPTSGSLTTPDTPLSNPAVAKDVYINDDITSITSPNVYRINAQNVYISKDVKSLKNIIINAKNVYTCSDGTSKVAQSDWNTKCTNPLRIEGSINAQNLYLMRSTGTRYKSDGTGSQSVVGALGQPAEVIVYPAYFYFTNVGGSSGSTKGSIDSYSQVAPRL